LNQPSGSGAKRAGCGRANVLSVTIFGASDSGRAEILAVLGEMAEPVVEVVEAKPGAEESHEWRAPEVVIAVLGEDRQTWGLQLQELTDGGTRPAIIAAIEDRSGEAVRQALRAGADDVFFLPAEVSNLSRCLVRVSESRTRLGDRTVVCAFSSVAGGVGVSTLTAAVGLAARRLDQRRVALIHLGMQSGALAALLDLNPEHTLSELADPSSKVDSLRLETTLTAHKSGLYLLAAPRRIEESEMVPADSIVAALAVMRELFDLILIDCGHHMSETLVTVWEHSTHLVYPVEQSVCSVRPAQRFLEMYARLGLNDLDLEFILNRYAPASPFTPEKIEAALQRPLAARVPRDDEALVQFQLGGADLGNVAPRSVTTAAIDQLTRMVCGMANVPESAEKLPLLARVRAAFRSSAVQAPAALLSDRRGIEPSVSGS
jgi:pilus assembly protein CpaE